MDIDVMGWIQRTMKPKMVSPEDALPGRESPVLHPIPRHTVLGLPLDEVPAGCEVAYFALGCFWGEERMYWQREGVVNTAVGYMGGYTPNPTYREVCTGQTGHAETVRVVHNPDVVGYDDLLTMFWEAHDPTQLNRQGNDIGTQYRSAVFPVDDHQREAAERTKAIFQQNLTDSGYGEIATEITPGQQFYYAEVEHQQYLDKNPDGYCPVHATGVRCRA